MKKAGVIAVVIMLSLIKDEILGLVILSLISIAGLSLLLKAFEERGK